MPAPPVMSVPTISPGEMQLLLSRAGLVLNPGQVADLVLAWRQVAGLIAAIPHDRPLADDAAYAFRLPPPAGSSAAVPRSRARPAARPKAAPKASPKVARKAPRKARAKPRPQAKRKVAPKRRAAAKAAPRKRARRGR
jgi:hypothetical protein